MRVCAYAHVSLYVWVLEAFCLGALPEKNATLVMLFPKATVTFFDVWTACALYLHKDKFVLEKYTFVMVTVEKSGTDKADTFGISKCCPFSLPLCKLRESVTDLHCHGHHG